MRQISGGIIELIVKNIPEVSYRVCAEMINNMTGLSISGVAVWNIVQQLGEEIKQYEKEKVEAFQEDKLKGGEKETPTIYQEADGIMIYTQGKDRQKQIEKYKKEHPNEEVPKKVRNIEIKLGMTYEGWKEININDTINKIKKIIFNPKTYAKFMDKNFATDYLTDTIFNYFSS